MFHSHLRRYRGAKELITEYWARQGKKKGEKGGRKSDTRPKAATRRQVAASVESTPEPVQGTKKRGRDRQKAKSGSSEEDAEEEEDTRSRKRGRRSNGVNRKASPSPASSSDRGSPVVDLLEPSAIKKWKNLPSWERHIDTIDTVEKTEDGILFIYFKMWVVRLSVHTRCLTAGNCLVGKAKRRPAKKTREFAPKNSHRRCAAFCDHSTFSI